MTMTIPRCHNIHNNSKDIQLHGGIERQARGQKKSIFNQILEKMEPF